MLRLSIFTTLATKNTSLQFHGGHGRSNLVLHENLSIPNTCHSLSMLVLHGKYIKNCFMHLSRSMVEINIIFILLFLNLRNYLPYNLSFFFSLNFYSSCSLFLKNQSSQTVAFTFAYLKLLYLYVKLSISLIFIVLHQNLPYFTSFCSFLFSCFSSSSIPSALSASLLYLLS